MKRKSLLLLFSYSCLLQKSHLMLWNISLKSAWYVYVRVVCVLCQTTLYAFTDWWRSKCCCTTSSKEFSYICWICGGRLIQYIFCVCGTNDSVWVFNIFKCFVYLVLYSLFFTCHINTVLADLCAFFQEFIFGLPLTGKKSASYLTTATDIQ